MTAPHSTPDQCLKAALPYLVLDFFFFWFIIRSPGGGESCFEGAWVQLSSLWRPGGGDPSTDGVVGESARLLLEGGAG